MPCVSTAASHTLSELQNVLVQNEEILLILFQNANQKKRKTPKHTKNKDVIKVLNDTFYRENLC